MSKADNLEFITFKQFIYTINIRDMFINYSNKELMDNQVIRLIYDSNDKDNYIDIGWYDYFNKDSVWGILEKTLNKNILASIVTDFRYDDDYKCIIVYLADKNIDESLKEYAN